MHDARLSGLTAVVADDTDIVLRAAAAVMNLMGFENVVAVSNPHKIVNAIVEHKAAILVTDFRMPGFNGAEVVALIKASGVKTKVVVMSGSPRCEIHHEFQRGGAWFDGFIQKPFCIDDFNKEICTALFG